MRLTIEGTKDEIVALVRELGEDEMLLTNADGLVDMTLPPKPEPVPRAGQAHASTSGGPVDPVVAAVDTIAEAHRKSLGGTSTFKEGIQ